MGGRCFFITPWLEGSGSLAVQHLFPFLPLSLSFSSSSSSLSLLVFLTCSSYTYTRQRSALTLSLPLPLWAACFVRDTRLKRWRGSQSTINRAAVRLQLLLSTCSPTPHHRIALATANCCFLHFKFFFLEIIFLTVVITSFPFPVLDNWGVLFSSFCW